MAISWGLGGEKSFVKGVTGSTTGSTKGAGPKNTTTTTAPKNTTTTNTTAPKSSGGGGSGNKSSSGSGSKSSSTYLPWEHGVTSDQYAKAAQQGTKLPGGVTPTMGGYTTPYGNVSHSDLMNYQKTGGNIHDVFSGSVPQQKNQEMEDEMARLYEELERLQNMPPPQQEVYMPSLPPPPPTLSAEEARQRAMGQLDPLYAENLQKALEQVDYNNIRRGFFGQLPGAELARSTAADIETRKAQAIGQLANQLTGQSEEGARAQQALALQARQQELQHMLSQQQLQRQTFEANRGSQLGLIGALLQAQQIKNQRDYQQGQLGLGYMPYVMPTYNEEANQYRDIFNTFQNPGQIRSPFSNQSATNNNNNPVAIRDYLGNANVGFRNSGGGAEVRVGNTWIPVSELARYGGYMSNNTTYLPPAQIEKLMRGAW